MKEGNAKKYFSFLSIVGLCLALVFGAVAPSFVEASATRKAGTIVELNGDVFVKKGAGKREIKAFKGMGVTEGDTIRTGKNAYARVEFDRNNATSLGGNTTITIAELRNNNGVPSTKVKQTSGGVWNKVKKTVGAGDTYEVATPTSIMGVRGTLFLTVVDSDGRTTLDVLDGIVGVDRSRRSSQTGSEDDEQRVNPYEQYRDKEEPSRPGDIQPFDVEQLNRLDIDLIIDMINDVLNEAEENEQHVRRMLDSREDTPRDDITEEMIEQLLRTNYLTELADLIYNQSTERKDEMDRRMREREQSRREMMRRLGEQQQRAREAQERALEEARRQADLLDRFRDRERSMEDRLFAMNEQRQRQEERQRPEPSSSRGSSGGGSSDTDPTPEPEDPDDEQPGDGDGEDPGDDPGDGEEQGPKPDAELSYILNDGVIEATKGESFEIGVEIKDSDGQPIENIELNEFSLDTSVFEITSIENGDEGRYGLLVDAMQPIQGEYSFSLIVRGVTLYPEVQVFISDEDEEGPGDGSGEDRVPDAELSYILNDGPIGFIQGEFELGVAIYDSNEQVIGNIALNEFSLNSPNFEIKDVLYEDQGQYWLLVEVKNPIEVEQPLSLTVRGVTLESEFYLVFPTGTVMGRVFEVCPVEECLQSPNLFPISDGTITIWIGNDKFAEEVPLDEDGRYRITDIPSNTEFVVEAKYEAIFDSEPGRVINPRSIPYNLSPGELKTVDFYYKSNPPRLTVAKYVYTENDALLMIGLAGVYTESEYNINAFTLSTEGEDGFYKLNGDYKKCALQDPCASEPLPGDYQIIPSDDFDPVFKDEYDSDFVLAIILTNDDRNALSTEGRVYNKLLAGEGWISYFGTFGDGTEKEFWGWEEKVELKVLQGIGVD